MSQQHDSGYRELFNQPLHPHLESALEQGYRSPLINCFYQGGNEVIQSASLITTPKAT